MEVEAVLVVGMRVLEIVGHPDDRRELKFVRGIEIGVADAASFGGSQSRTLSYLRAQTSRRID